VEGRGSTGARGPKGAQGTTGARGMTGAVGATGASARFPRSEALEVSEHLDGIYCELEVQMKRMGQIQQQLDELRSKVKRMFENSN
jgi:hypothetical protein